MTPPASLSTGRRQARYRQQPSWRVSVMNLLWLLRIPVILLGVLGLAWLTLLVAGWLQPLRPPRLFVIGGEYQNAQLPVNAFAGRDVTGLLSEAKLFDVVGNETEGRSLNLTEMRQMADRISELPRRQSIFFWRKTTNIVYVNALGLAVRDDSDPQNAKAYLLPREFDAAEAASGLQDHALPVRELLQSLGNSKADYKILVLDCQRAEQAWPVGVVSNQFVEAVSDELARLGESDEEQYGGLFVLFSCGPGEVTWTDGRRRRSVFAQYFVQGLRGAADQAGDRDGRVSLQEVAEFVRTQTDTWVSRNRADRQRPLLLSAATDKTLAKNIMLATYVSSPSTLSTASGSPDALAEQPDSQLDRLEQNWKTYFDLARSEPHPTHFAPHDWRRLEAVLLRAEALYRAGSMAAMNEELDKFVGIEDLLKVAELNPLDQEPAYSLPMLELFGHQFTRAVSQIAEDDQKEKAGDEVTDAAATAEPGGDSEAAEAGSDGESPAADDQPEDELSPQEASVKAVLLLQEIETPQQLQAAAQTFQQDAYQAITLPVEAEFIRMMAANWPVTDANVQPELMSEALQNLRLLKKAEAAAVPVRSDERRLTRRYSPQIFAWIRSDVDQADRIRRINEDKFFIADRDDRVWLGSAKLLPGGDDLAHAEMLYDRAIEDAEIVGSAIRDWERGMAELPYFVRLACARPPLNLINWRSLLETCDSDHNGTVSQEEYEAVYDRFEEIDLDGNDELTVEDFGAANISRFQDTVFEETSELLLRLQELAAALFSSPPDRSRVGLIESLSSELQEFRIALLEKVTTESDELLRALAEETTATGTVWRELDAILEIPFIGVAGEVEPASLARNRVDLLRLVGIPQLPAAGPELDHDPERESALAGQPDFDLQDALRLENERRARLALKFYGLMPDGQPETKTDLQGGFSRTVAVAWKDCYDALTSTDENRLRQSDVANRILAPALTESSDRAFRLLRQREWGEFLAWQALRRAEDFWAGPSRPQPYFQTTAADYLELSKDFAPQAGRQTRETLRRWETVSREFGTVDGRALMQSRPAEPVFRGTDNELVEINVPQADNLPPGLARLRLSAEDKTLSISPLSAATADEAVLDFGAKLYPFELTRPSAAGFNTAVAPELFFRGHVARQALPVIGASEIDGPTTVYRGDASGETQLVVRLSDVIPNPIEVLFVLDCSRSMLEDDRMQALQDSLVKFADEASEIGLSVGVRVFGDRVIWQKNDAEAEAQARQDTRILIPLGEFRREEFQNAVTNLEATGESPLFYALLAARGDFVAAEPVGETEAANALKGGKKLAGRKLIVVISDGQDNWTRIGEKPGLNELQEAYRESNISINTIGFQVDEAGLTQLQQIAAVGGGTAVKVDQADELLTEVLGLTKVFRYEVYQSAAVGFSTQLRSARLDFSGEPLPVSAGEYEVRVVGSHGNLITERSGIRIQTGQRHELLFDGGELEYPRADIEQDVAAQFDSNSGMLLRVMRAALLESEPADDGTRTLELDIGLANERETSMFPRDVQFRVQPQGSPRIYSFEDLPSNVPGYHFSVWRLRLENWPADVLNVKLDASWLKASEADRPDYVMPFREDGGLRMVPAARLPDGIQLTRRKFAPYPLGESMQDVATVTLVFPRDYAGSIQDWSFTFNKSISFARQIYNTEDGICTGHFVFADGASPDTVIVRGPHLGDERSTLGTAFSLNLRKIN